MTRRRIRSSVASSPVAFSLPDSSAIHVTRERYFHRLPKRPNMQRRASLLSNVTNHPVNKKQPATPTATSAIAPLATGQKHYVEFHASMSLENPASLLAFLPEPTSAPASSDQQPQPGMHATTTLNEILMQRCRVWSKVDEVRTLTPVPISFCSS